MLDRDHMKHMFTRCKIRHTHFNMFMSAVDKVKVMFQITTFLVLSIISICFAGGVIVAGVTGATCDISGDCEMTWSTDDWTLSDWKEYVDNVSYIYIMELLTVLALLMALLMYARLSCMFF